jgi:hypothetical protein
MLSVATVKIIASRSVLHNFLNRRENMLVAGPFMYIILYMLFRGMETPFNTMDTFIVVALCSYWGTHYIGFMLYRRTREDLIYLEEMWLSLSQAIMKMNKKDKEALLESAGINIEVIKNEEADDVYY